MRSGDTARMGPTGTAAERLDWVDVAKALCIVMVVAMHSTLGVEEAAGRTGWMGAFIAFAQPFRMPDFFLIAGLFLSRVLDRDWRTFLDRRVVHFGYFYLLWLTIQFVFKAPGMVVEGGIDAAAMAYVRAIFVEPFGTLWFIWMLPVFAVLVRLTKRVPWPVMLAIAAALEIAPIATGHLVVDEFAARFVYFYAGYALASRIFAVADSVDRNASAALAALGLWALVNGVAVTAGVAHMPIISLFLGTVGSLAIVAMAVLATKVAALRRPLMFLGERSIVVYLAFFLPMAAMRVFLLRTGLSEDVGTVSLVTTVFAVLVPLAIWWVAMRLGIRFLFERPAWARLDAPRGKAAAAPSHP